MISLIKMEVLEEFISKEKQMIEQNKSLNGKAIEYYITYYIY